MTGLVLVTGATGTVGASVVAELLTAGERVRAATTRPGKMKPGPDPVHFDFSEPSTWAPAFDGVDRLFLMRPPEISDVKTFLRPVIRLAVDRGIHHVVFLSVMGVNRLLPHWQVERDIKSAALSYTFLRPSFFAQNLLSAYRSDIVDHDRIRLASGRGRTSFVDTRDVAAVGAAALLNPDAHADAAYTLTGPESLTYHQVASLLSARLGRPIDYEPIGLLRYRRELLAQDLDPAYVNVQLVINAVAALGRAGTRTADLETLLGRPPISLAQFIDDHAAAWES